MNWTGIGYIDKEKARAADVARLRLHDAGYCVVRVHDRSPERRQAGRHPTGGTRDLVLPPTAIHRARIRRALSWDGDTGRPSSRSLLGARSTAPASGEGARASNSSTSARWVSGRPHGETTLPSRRRSPASARHGLIRPWLSQERPPGIRQPVRDAARRDESVGAPVCRKRGRKWPLQTRWRGNSSSRSVCGERLSDANIQIARLWEKEGDPRAALRAIERRTDPFRWAPLFMSTYPARGGPTGGMDG